MGENTIHIVTATDNSYAEHLAVMLYSLLANKASSNPIAMYVISSELSEQNKALLKRAVGKFNQNINFLNVDPRQYEPFMKSVTVGKYQKYLTKETYYRISIPDLLKKDIQKVIYLDCDMIVKADITRLWDKKLDVYYLGAVEDHWAKKTRNSDLLIPADSKYFNAGMLVINLKKWREAQIKNKIIDYIQKHAAKIKFYSQDPMNAVLHDKWLQLNVKWNYQTEYLKYPELKGIRPAIIHYTGGHKPWKAESSDGNLSEEYMKYRKKAFN